MKIPPDARIAICIIPVFILFLLCSCSDSSSPESDWENIGVQQVFVEQLDIPDTSTTVDTLSIGISGVTETTGLLTLSTIEAERTSDDVTLTIWAEVKKWVGSGIMPTIDPSIQCTYKAIPPFASGIFYIIVEQPDGAQMIDSLLIES